MRSQAALHALERLRSIKLTSLSPPKCPSCGAHDWKLACAQCGHERVRVSEETRLAFDILNLKFFVGWTSFGRTFARALRDPVGLVRGFREEGGEYLDRAGLLRPVGYFVSSIGILVLLYSLLAAETASSLAGSAAYFVLFVITSLVFATILHRASRVIGGTGKFSDTFTALVYGHGAQLSIVPILSNLALLSGPSAGTRGMFVSVSGVLLVGMNLVFLVWSGVRTIPGALAEVHGFGATRAYVVIAAVGILFYLLGNLVSPYVNFAMLPR